MSLLGAPRMSIVPRPAGSNLMTPAEVAAVFAVDPKTTIRWAKAGKLTTIRTPGGHRRFLRSEVQEQLDASREERRS